MSVFTISLIIGVFAMLSMQMISNEYIKIQKNEIFTNTYLDQNQYNLSATDWKFYLFMMSSMDIYASTPINHSEYYTVYLLSYDNENDRSDMIIMEPWTEDIEGYSNPYKYGVTYCTDYSNLMIKSTFADPDGASFMVVIVKWMVNCPADLGDFMSYLIMQVIVRDYYIDYKDIDNPIKYTYDNFNLFTTNDDKSLILNIEVEASTYELKDNYFNSYDTKSGIFYSLGRSVASTGGKELSGITLANIFFILGKKKAEYVREVYNIFDLVSEIGGIYQSIQFLPLIIFAFISSKLFYYSVIKEKIKDIEDDDLQDDPFQNIEVLTKAVFANQGDDYHTDSHIKEKMEKIEAEIELNKVDEKNRK